MNRQKCIIIVPIYKKELDNDEFNSVKQLFKVLPVEKYDIIAIHPESLDLSYYVNNFNFTSYYQFWDTYFTDYPKGYNSLMLNYGFYKMFDRYEYMLIYQTDCWVFRDELEYWCNKEYDFIGAPQILRYPDYLNTNTYIGNGGFSLRKIKTFLHICKDYDNLCNRIITANDKLIGEDHIVMHILNTGVTDYFNIPSFYEAAHFAFETNPGILYQLTNGKLPFGCHAYKKVIGYTFWDDFINYEKKRYSVVTFLFGDYDDLKDPYIVDDAAEYICITDRTDLKSDVWNIENITEYDISNYNSWQKTMIARYTALNHIHTDYCVVIDASIQIKKPLHKFINMNAHSDVGFIIHPFRDSYLDELDEWIEKRNLDPQQKEDFKLFCDANKFDYNTAKGFIMSTVMFFKNSERSKLLMKTVLEALMNNFNFSIRVDQLYLSVIFFKYFHMLYRDYFSYQILLSDYFDYYYHGSNITHDGDYDVDLHKQEIREVYYNKIVCKYLT